MRSYNIQIDETQRQMLVQFLTESDFTVLVGKHPKTGYELPEEAQVLLEMLRELPADEDQTPGATHCLCL